MRLTRIACLSFVASLALCAIGAATATSALAFEAEFSKLKDPFTSKSATSIMTTPNLLLKCTSDKMAGETATATTLSVSQFLLEGCGGICTGTVGFETSGELGEVEKVEAASKRGVLFTLNAHFTCAGKKIEIIGKVAAEVAELTKTKEFIFALDASLEQKIKKITLKSGPVKTGFKINGENATYQSTEENTWNLNNLETK